MGDRLRGFIAVMVVLTALFGVIPTSAAEFSDVSKDDWYYSYVTSLADAGAVSGYPDGTFRPDGLITRAEFTTIVLNTMGVDSVKRAMNAVGNSVEPGDYWAKPTVVAANYYKIATFGSGPASWGKPITRAEMAYVGMKAAEILGRQSFPIAVGTEALIADWDKCQGRPESQQILKAYSNGVLVGKDEMGTFMPDGTATRAEACVMVMRLIVPSLRAVV